MTDIYIYIFSLSLSQQQDVIHNIFFLSLQNSVGFYNSGFRWMLRSQKADHYLRANELVETLASPTLIFHSEICFALIHEKHGSLNTVLCLFMRPYKRSICRIYARACFIRRHAGEGRHFFFFFFKSGVRMNVSDGGTRTDGSGSFFAN